MTWLAKGILIVLAVWLFWGLRWMAHSKRVESATSKLVAVTVSWAFVFALTLLMSDFSIVSLWWDDTIAFWLIALNAVLGVPCLIAGIISFAICVRKEDARRYYQKRRPH